MDEPFKRTRYDTEEEWHALRKQCIGGSDAAAIVGCNPWKTSVDLYKIKKGLMDPKAVTNPEAVEFGKESEEFIRCLFQLRFKEHFKVIHTFEHLTRLDKPYLGASLDGEIICIKDYEFRSYGTNEPFLIREGMHGVWECKTTSIENSMHKEHWTNQIPQNYYVQAFVHYLDVTRWDFTILTALLEMFRCEEIRNYGDLAINRLEDMKYLEAEEDKWWNNYYLKGIEPPLRLPTI